MNKLKEREYEDSLVTAVMDQMLYQVEMGDWTAIDELLRYVPHENLINFLPDAQQENFKQ